ncbi:MAG TPA: response regulator transcription factor [Verrucomicrobiae bacterium]|nr:response regulator transcription factor [Verrucomicrobiae bacterium]
MKVEGRGDVIRLLLVDDRGLFRDSLCRYLASEPGMRVMGECSTPEEAIEFLPGANVDLILLDFEPGSSRSNQFMTTAVASGYAGRFLMIATRDDAHGAAIALKLGASGIFLKSEPLGRLVQAIHSIADGQVWVDAQIIRTFADRIAEREAPFVWGRLDSRLEGRERQVLDGILGGLTNKKIGDGLGLSEASVKNTVQRLFRKTGVKTRSQLVRAALEVKSLAQSQD